MKEFWSKREKERKRKRDWHVYGPVSLSPCLLIPAPHSESCKQYELQLHELSAKHSSLEQERESLKEQLTQSKDTCARVAHELEATQDASSQQQQQLEADLAAASERLKIAQSDVQQKIEDISRLTLELEASHRKIASQESNADASAQQLASLSSAAKEAAAKVEELELQCKAQEEALHAAQQQRDEANALTEETKNIFIRQKLELQKQLSSTQQQIEVAQQETAASKDKLAQHDKSLAASKKKIDKLESKRRALETELLNAQEAAAAASELHVKETTRLNQLLASLEATLGEKEAKLAALQEKMDVLDTTGRRVCFGLRCLIFGAKLCH